MKQERILKDGERRNVTALFTDMEDFSSLSERLDPEELNNLMNLLFERFTFIIKRHEGTVEKYIGDALVAVFGVPQTHEDDPIRAVHAAYEFSHEVADLSKGLIPGGIHFRTGIHTGLITTGQRGDYSVVTGHTMSVASRIQKYAPANGIVVSSDTAHECSGEFQFSEAFQEQLKGISETISIQQVQGLIPSVLKPMDNFFGRQREIETIVRTYMMHNNRAVDGITLTGPGGIGKTALLRYVVDSIKKLPGFNGPVLYARARKFRRIPFATAIDLFFSAAKIDIYASSEIIIHQLQKTFDFPESIANSLSKLADNFHFDEKQLFSHLSRASSKLFNNQNSYSPLIIIDNSQNVDPQSISFLRYVVEQQKRKLFFLLSERSGDSSIANYFSDFEQLELNPLDDEESQEFCRQEAFRLISSWQSIPEKEQERIIQTIVKKSQGRPLFIQTFLKYLANKELTLEDNYDVSLPSSIQNLFMSEFDTYNSDIKDFLKKLSVFVKTFSFSDAVIVQEQSDGDPAIVADALDFFLKEGIIKYSSGTYSFINDVQKEALYTSLLNHNKKILHGIIVDIMVQQKHCNHLRLIHHLIASEQYSKALETIHNWGQSSETLELIPLLNIIEGKIDPMDREKLYLVLFHTTAIYFNSGEIKKAMEIVERMLHIGQSEQINNFTGTAYHVLAAQALRNENFLAAHSNSLKAKSYYELYLKRDPQNFGPLHNLLSMGIVSYPYYKGLGITFDYQKELEQYAPNSLLQLELSLLNRYITEGKYRLVRETLDRISSYANFPEYEDDPEFRFLISDFLLKSHNYKGLIAQSHQNKGDRQNTSLGQLIENCAWAIANHYENSPYENRESGFNDQDRYLRQAEFFLLEIKNNPDLVNAHGALAHAYLNLGDLKKAKKHAEKGINLAQKSSLSLSIARLLSYLLEIAWALDEHKLFFYLLNEAPIVLSDTLIIHRQTKIKLHYFLFYGNSLKEDVEKSNYYKEQTENLLNDELIELKDSYLIKNFFHSNAMERILDDLSFNKSKYLEESSN